MLKVILTACICFLSLSQAAVYFEHSFLDPTHPGKCVIKDKILTPGESIKHPVMDCAQFTCVNSRGVATIETCDPVSALPPPLTMIKYDPAEKPTCTWGEFIDTTTKFPKCCKRHFTCDL